MRRNTQSESPASLDRLIGSQDRSAFYSRMLRGGRLTKWKGQVASYAPYLAQLVSSKARLWSVRLLPAALLAGLAAGTAAAETLYWDPLGFATGRGGSGTWTTVSTPANPNLFWDPTSSGVCGGPCEAWVNDAANPNDAIFGDDVTGTGFTGTVTLGTAITVHNMTFENDTLAPGVETNYIITGNTLTLGGVTPTINVVGTGLDVVTIDSIVAGTSGLTKTGGGVLALNGTNTFTGTVAVNAGTLAVDDNAALGHVDNGVTMAAGTTLTSAGALSASRVVTLSSGQVNIGGAGVGSAFFTGTGGLNVQRNVTLSNSLNDYTGQTRFVAAQLVTNVWDVTSVANAGEVSALGAATGANATILIQAHGNSGEAILRYTGAAGSTDRNWQINSGGFGEAELRNSGSGLLTLTGGITLGGVISDPVTLRADTADIQVGDPVSGGGVISSSGAAPLVLQGGGIGRTITLYGDNTYIGSTSIGTVTVKVDSLADTGTVSSLGTGADIGANVSVNIVNGALSYIGSGSSSNRTWGINAAGNIRNDGTGALNLSGSVTFSAGGSVENLTLGGSFAGVNTLSGQISGVGNLIMNGTGTWVISGNNTYTGAVTVNNGTLQAGSAQAFSTTNTLTVNGGTLDLNGFDRTVTSLAGTGGSVALNGGADLTVSGTTSTTYSGSITGDGGLVKRGTSTLTLTGTSTYTGDTTINGGALALNFTGAGNDIISGDSTLVMSGGTLTATGASGQANIQNFDGLNIIAGSNRLNAVGTGGGSMTVDVGAINRTGGLADFGIGTGGTIHTDNAEGFLGGWATVTVNNVTNYANVDATGNIVAFTDYDDKDEAATWADGDVVSDDDGDAATFSGTVAATDITDPDGDGKVELGGLQYTVNAASTVNIGAGQTLSIDGNIIVSSTVLASAKVIGGAGQLTGGANGGPLGILHNGTGNFTVSAQIVDNADDTSDHTSFVKGGAGTVILNNDNNSYTGATILSGGVLAVSSIGSGGANSAIGASTSDSSNLVLEGGTLRFLGTGTNVTDRGFTLVNGGSSRVIEVNSATSLEFEGVVTSADDAGFNKTGFGTLILSNDANDYKGVTRIENGILSVDTLANGGVASGIGMSSSNSANLVLTTAIGGGGSVPGTLQYTGGTVSSDRGFTLAGGAGAIDVSAIDTDLTLSGAAIGTGILHKNGAGTLILSGTNTYTGGTVVNAGTLQAGSSRAFGGAAGGAGVGSMTVNAGATMDLAGNNNFVGGLNGAGTVTLGSATLTINNNSTATGFTGNITGPGGVTLTAGTQVMNTCGSDYAGVTRIQGGAVLSTNCLKDAGVASGIGASTNVSGGLVLANGTLRYTGIDESINRGFTIETDTAGAIDVTNLATTLEIEGIIAGGGTLIKRGTGTLLLSADNTYTGETQIEAGTLRLGVAGALSANGVRLSNVASAELELNGFNTTVAWLHGGGVAGGNIDLGGATLTISAGHTTVAYAGAIIGAGNLVKSGNDVQRLTGGCNSSYTGTTTINGTNANAVLEVSCLTNGGANSSIGMSGSEASNLVLNGGTLRYIGAGNSTDRLFSLGSSATSALDATGTGAIHFTNEGAIAFTTANTAQTITLKGESAVAIENTFALQIRNNGTGITSLTKTGSNLWILENENSDYTGVTTILGGVLGVDKLANGGVASSIGMSSNLASNLVIGSGATLRYTGTGDTTDRLFTLQAGTSSIESSGTGGIIFSNTGSAAYTGTGARTLALGGTNTDLNIMGGLIIDGPGGTTTLVKNGPGTWALTGNNTFTGNTTINDGNLIVGDLSVNGGTTGNVGAGNVIVNTPTSVLSFNRTNAFDVIGLISGTGSIAQIGTGTTTLTRNNTYTGTTTVQSGALLINGNQSGATGDTNVLGGALGGTGTIGGNVIVADGATLRPGGTANNGIGTLTINGNLTLNDASIVDVQFGQAGTVGGPQNDLIAVGGNLTLDGELNVTQGPSFGPGVYRIVSYGGSLTNNGLNSSTPDFYVQTSIGGQVNLVNTQGVTLNFWDGQIPAQKNNNVVNGGDGTWHGSGGNDNWTTAAGTFNAPFTTAAIAIFGGTAGTVTVDNDEDTGDVIASGMQFLTNGYTIQGETITLVENSANPGQSVITVGDGTVPGAAITATISADLTGATQLVKADLGTLVLSATNSYSGGTAINSGVLQVADDGNLGIGALTFNGGTLRNTGAIVTSRIVTLNAGGGTFETVDELTLTGLVSGAGSLTKTGTSTLTLIADNNYGGGTTIGEGTLQLGNNTNTGSITGDVNILSAGTLAFNRSNDYLFAGQISGDGAVTQIGDGITILTADNTYTGGTTITAGTLQLGNGGITGSIQGAVTNDGTLIFNRSNELIFGGVISGSGDVIKRGTGTTILTGPNTYGGETTVEVGTLLVNGNQSGATGDTTVLDDATLGGIGTIGGNVIIANGGTLSPGEEGNAPGTLTITGNLVLNETSNLNVNFGQADVVGGQLNDHIVVGGALTLDGTLNVTETGGGTFGPGIYRVITYSPSAGFDDNGLAFNNPNFTVQTSIAGQVNLINTAGLQLNFWDGDDGALNTGVVDGGDGTWLAATGDNWTTADGTPNAEFDNGSFAIFAGTAGTVNVSDAEGTVNANGMHFDAGGTGYVIQGDDINLVDDVSNPGVSIIRVGNGVVSGADYVATVNSNLTGTTQLVKTDFGTLVLGGANSYEGGTAINTGVLQVANDGNLGDLDGDLSFDGGTLRNTDAFASERDVLLNDGGGSFETQANLSLNGIISGEGNLTKTGSSALILTDNNTYTGTTTVSAGTLIVDGNQSAATGDTTVSAGATLGGSGRIGGNVTVDDNGILAPGGLTGTGVGTLTIAGNLTLGDAILNYSFGDGAVAGLNQPGGGELNDLVNVEGDLVLDGVINVTETPGETFGPGIYRVFNYSGELTNNVLELGNLPDGNYLVQTSTTGQVNLVNTAGLTLNYWDGETGGRNDGNVAGGDGIWRPAGDDNWTTEIGVPNAAYSQSSVAVFSGAAGTVTVADGGVIDSGGMLFVTDGYLVTGGPINLVGAGTSTIQVGNGNASSASYVATIESDLTGDSQLVKTDFGTLVLAGANSYSGGTNIVGGTLQVSEDGNLGDDVGNLSFANNAALRTTGTFATDRDVTFNAGGGTFLTDDATILTVNGVLSGAGNFTKAGTGKLVLTSDSSGYTATTEINAGSLTVNGSLCGTVNVNSGARLEGTGTVCDTNNNAGGTVAPGDGGIGALTVDGNYVGGGLLEIEAVLEGDDPSQSQTDLLRVTGNTSGTTTMTVTNLGGGGAQTVVGIKVVDVGGTSDGVFNLQGDYVFQNEQAVVAGAFAYVLRKDDASTPGEDGDWYLRSTLKDGPPAPIYSPAAPVYEAFAAILQEFDELETLQRRIGNRQWLGGEGGEAGAVESQGLSTGEKSDRLGVWARIKAGHAHLEPDNASTVDDYDVTSWKIQAGADALLSDSDAGSLIGGLALHFGTASASIDSFFGDGNIDVTGYGISGTLTWYSSGGFYVDTQAQASLYDSDLSSDEVGELEDGSAGWGYALSIESGQKLPISSHWSLTPQAQLTYAEVDFDDFTDPFDGEVSLQNSDTLIGRLGLTADYENEWQDEMGQMNRSHLYGITSVYYDFLDGTEVDVSGTSFFLENEDLWGSAGFGGSLAWADDKYAVYGEALAKTSLESFGDSYAVSGTAGFRLRW